jgi:anti-sigma B factor antagonist
MPTVSNMPWEVKMEDMGEETRVYFTGADVILDESSSDALHDRLFEIVENSGRSRIALDLANVSYLTSAALGVFLQLHKMLQGVGGRLTLNRLQPQIHEIFTLTSLQRVLEIHPG